jgi:phosphatidylserine synthase
VLYVAALSSSLARAGTEISNAAASSGIPIKAAAIFFIIAVPSCMNFLFEPLPLQSGNSSVFAMLVPPLMLRKSTVQGRELRGFAHHWENFRGR